MYHHEKERNFNRGWKKQHADSFIITMDKQRKVTGRYPESKRLKGVVSESKLIMVVDDEAVIIDVLCSFLEKRGYKTFAIKDGQSAVSCAEKKKPDLVFLDIKMPGLNGIETCNRLKQTLQSSITTGIFMITGYYTRENVEKSYSAGAADVIKKPFDLEDINRRINKWFDLINVKDGSFHGYEGINIVNDINNINRKICHSRAGGNPEKI